MSQKYGLKSKFTRILRAGGLVVLAALLGACLLPGSPSPQEATPVDNGEETSTPPPIAASITADPSEATAALTEAPTESSGIPALPGTTLWGGSFSDGSGWKDDPSYWETIAYPDLNGDGKADVCGRAGDGIRCAVSNSSTFGEVSVWQASFSDADGWKDDPSYWETIAFPDISGDGQADVCGRGPLGINCAISTGSSFGETTLWSANFSDANRWKEDPAYWGTIVYPDVNGDSLADVCGRGIEGIYCALSTGASFGEATVWRDTFSDVNGWKTDPAYWQTIRFPDLNGDGLADVCGRGIDGVYCAPSTGSAFGEATRWHDSFSDADGWKSNIAFWGTIAYPDLNGDGLDDVCGRAIEGIYCALSSSSSFGELKLWRDSFSDANGWNRDASYWSTILYPDLNGDGKADVCGRGVEGLNCGLSDGLSFAAVTVWNNELSDANGWSTDSTRWSTIFFPDVNGDGPADLCARFTDGIHCGLSTGSAFQAAEP